MPSKQYVNRMYCLLQIGYWGMLGSFTAFQTAILLDRGFSSGDVGIFLALSCFSGMIAMLTANEENMLQAARKGFINATDLADYLVKKGMPFRSAYKISGQLVALCISGNTVLEDLPLETYQNYSELFAEDLYEAIDLVTCVQKRISRGGPSEASVEEQLAYVRKMLA